MMTDSTGPERQVLRLLPIGEQLASLPGYVVGILFILAATVLCELLQPFLYPLNQLMIYLIVVVLAALNIGLKPTVMVVLLSAFLHNYLYMPPRFSVDLQHKEYLAISAGLLVAGCVISVLVASARNRAEALLVRESETSSLYGLSRDFVAATDRSAVISAVIANIETTLNSQAALFLEQDGRLELTETSSIFTPDKEQEQDAAWSFTNSRTLEHYRPFIGTFCCLPLQTATQKPGVLAVLLTSRSDCSPKQAWRLLKAFASQTALALERVELVRQAELAQTLRSRQRLERALLNSVSHDLRTPLSTITGVLSSILEEGERLSPSAHRELLENARDEADRLNRFVSKLLDMTRIESGAMNLRQEPCDLQDLIGCSLERVERQLLDREVLVTIPPDLPLVPLDMVLMLQVLVNLLDNANKYAPQGTPLEITASIDSGYLQLVVSDHGPGVPEGELEKIFEKFYRVPVPEGAEGTGLGLSICRGIVEAHGGRLRAENRVDSGLSVILCIPFSLNYPDEVAA